MSDIEIYTRFTCGYCLMAKRLLSSKGVEFTEISVDDDEDKLAEMLDRSEGRMTVPQIFIDGKGYGGFDEISGLNMAGKLDDLLGVPA